MHLFPYFEKKLQYVLTVINEIYLRNLISVVVRKNIKNIRTMENI
jgi:accessory colonization factor AcfC